MIEIKIPKEIEQYDAKVIGPFSIRQAVCGGTAALLSYGLYNLFYAALTEEQLIGIIIAVSVPFGLIGWIRPYGMRFEKFFMAVLFNTIISSPKRYFRQEYRISSFACPEGGRKKDTGNSKEKERRICRKAQRKYQKQTCR